MPAFRPALRPSPARREAATRRGAPTRAATWLAGAGAAALAYGSLIERQWFALRHVTVPALRPGTGRPLRVLHLSDLHLAPGQRRKAEFVRSCRAAGADLVVVTGDILGHRDAVPPAVRLLVEVAADTPAVAVLGSNDFIGPVLKNPLAYLRAPSRSHRGQPLDTAGLVQGLRAAGWHVLDNERRQLPTAAGTVDVVGLGDGHILRDRPEDVDWTPPAEDIALRLGLVHSPYQRSLQTFARQGFDLVLAGHTHGGQVRVPGVGALVTNCDLPAHRARGLSRCDDGPWLHVSAGLGTAITAPVRFACRPEATVLDVVSPAPATTPRL